MNGYGVDPITKILYNQVTVNIAADKAAEEFITGFLVAADPISQSCVLLTGEINEKDPLKSELVVIPEVEWSQVTALPNQPDISSLKQVFNRLSADADISNSADLTPDMMEKMTRLQKFVEARNLTVVVQGSSLRVQNCVSILAPFSSADCRATNEIVLERVANLVNQFNAQE